MFGWCAHLSRTTAPHSSKGPALIAFMRHNKWRRLVILTSTDEVYFHSGLGLAKQLKASSNKVLKPEPFEPGNIKDVMLSEIRRSGIRIVVVLAYDADAQTVASLAHREGMGAGFAWVLPRSEVLLVPDLLGWLWFRTFLPSDMDSFAKQVSRHSKSYFDITVRPDSVDLTYSAALYTAIMLYAHAATNVMLEGGELQDAQAVTAAVRNTTVQGVGGTVVELNSNGDGIVSYEVMNYVLKEGDVMSSVPVGMFNSTLGQYKAYEPPVVWPGNTLEVPVDYFSGKR